MDCSNKRSKHPYLRPLLYKQFKEQSPVCDVTITVGLWEKRFHWCVLMASPFFENIHRNNFLERQTGTVALNEWPSSLVERALLFLYGKKPNVTEANVDKLLDIAEFLLIPELKVACIDFLKRTKLTPDNCIKYLELSSTYGFVLKRCRRFILGKLPEVLEQGGMLNATTESVKMLLADPTLSYVPVQKWFNFLIRWVQKAPERQGDFAELFNMLEFGECDRDFINNIITNEPLVINTDVDVERVLTRDLDGTHDTVLICNEIDSLICIDMRTLRWYRIDIPENKAVEGIRQFRNYEIAGVKNRSSSSIYKVRDAVGLNILTQDLSSAQSLISKVGFTPTDDDDDVASFSFINSYSLSNDMLAAVSSNVGTMNSSILFIGKLNGPVTEMQAILTIRNHNISEICYGENGTIAMLSTDKDCLFIFDEPTGELERIQLNVSYGIGFSCQVHLSSFRNGFVLHDTDKVVYILRLSGASLQTKYLVKQLTWEEHDESHTHRYVFDGERWFRYKFQGYRISEASLEYVSHDDLTILDNTALLPWKIIPLPPNSQYMIRFGSKIHAVSLPKGVTRCHLDCPHCKMPKYDRLQQRPSEESDSGSDYMYDPSDPYHRTSCQNHCECCCYCDEDEYEYEDEDSDGSSEF